MRVNFNVSDFERSVAKSGPLILKNRYFEQNPSLTEDGATLIARPGLNQFVDLGEGPIRGLFSEPGSFNGDLFAVASNRLVRIDKDRNVTTIFSSLAQPDTGFVNMAITGNIGTTPPFLFIADGTALYVYKDDPSPSITQVVTPDDVGIIDVAVVSSYVICIPAQGEGINGRFYFIRPGETTIVSTDFATAERSPDAIYSVEVIGDQFYLPGESTIEVWFVTGELDNPVRRLQGVVIDRGTWENTAVSIKQDIFVCDAEGGVFQVNGGNQQRVSTPDIEEIIRKAISTQQFFTA